MSSDLEVYQEENRERNILDYRHQDERDNSGFNNPSAAAKDDYVQHVQDKI